MAVNFTEKSERLLQSRRYTHDNFTDSQEAFTSTLDINANEVYVDQGLIPYTNLPFSGSGQSGSIYSVNGQNVAQYYYRWPLTRSNLVSGSANEVWFVLSPTGSSAGIGAQLIDPGQQTNFISPKYASSSLANATAEDSPAGYVAKVFVSNNAAAPAAGDVVSANNYTFDYKTGVLQFLTNALAPTTAQYVYISAYQYKGRVLSDNITNVSASIAAISASVGGSGTGSLQSRVTNLEQVSASLNTYTASINNKFTTLGSLTGSYATTGSNFFNGNQTITGSLTVSGSFIVIGSSSIQNISSSTLNIGTNLITVNTSTPISRFGGLAVIDSGSTNLSGSILFDSINNQWIFQHQAVSGSSTTSSIFITGPETLNNLGSETNLTLNRIPKIKNGAHLYDSNISDDGITISLGSATVVTGSVTASAFLGSIAATNNVVSSSSNTSTIIHTITAGVVSAYAVGGIVSGSSQIDINSVTNFSTFSSSVSTNFSASAASVVSLSSSVSASIYSLSASVGSGNIGSSVTQLNTFSASVLTQLTTLGGVTSSFNGHTASVNAFTASILSETGSIESRFATLASITSSYNQVTASLNAYTSSAISQSLGYNAYTASAISQSLGFNAETASIEGRFTTLASVTQSYNAATASLNAATASLYAFTASILSETGSIEGRFTTLASVTASLNQVTASLNTYTASAISQSLGFNAYTASAISQSLGFNAETASIENRFATLASVTSSFNTFTASILSETGSIEGRFATLASVTSSFNTFTSSAGIRLNNLETTSASVNISVANINSFTSSAIGRLTNLESTSASVNTSLANINNYTSSLIGALQVVNTNKLQTTSDLTIGGNLYVNGTTTTVNSTQVSLSSSVIAVDAGGGVNGGIYVTDKIGTTGTGSFLWDVTNNYWIAGLSGSEQRILTVGGMNIVSGSSQIDVTQTTNFTSFSSSVSSSITALSASIGSGNISSSISQLNTFTASLSPTSNVTFAGVTSSFNIATGSVSGSATSKRMAFRDTNGTLALVQQATNVGDFVQWDGGSFIMSNVVDGGSF